MRSETLSYIFITPIDTIKEVSPHSIVTYQIDITNKGYFTEIISTEITSPDYGISGILSEQGLIINPNDTRRVTLSISTPEIFFDPGTSHIVNISAYSTRNPEQKFHGEVQVRTKGLYFSPLIFVVLAIIIFMIIIVFVIMFLISQKTNKKFFSNLGKIFEIKGKETIVKPDKPWLIPEEKKYLEKLKKKDIDEYKKTRQMMEDEYKSAILWYENYRSILKEKERKQKANLNVKRQREKSKEVQKIEKTSKENEKPDDQTKLKKIQKQKESLGKIFTNFFKGYHKKPEESKLTIKKEKITEETKDKEKDKAPKADSPKKTAEQRRKEKVLLKIKRKQEKQKVKTQS
jgi:hypothetical protein